MSKLSKLLQQTIDTSLGKFKLVKILGQGGAGVVFEAIKSEKQFAIKFLLESSSQKLARFIDEYLGIMQVSPQRHIARPIHFGELLLDDVPYPYIIMRKYDGTLVRCEQSKLVESVNQLAKQLLDGIEHLHLNGIIHRDLKPNNIFIDGEDFVIGDFGIASFDPSLFVKNAETEKGERLANFEFSAPEQAHSVAATRSMDFYAFGQILQWYCFGNVHKGTSRKLLTNLSEQLHSLDSIVDMCIRNDPNERPKSVAEIRAALYGMSEDEAPKSGLSKKTGPDKWDMLKTFEDALRKSFPKTITSYASNRKDECNRLMSEISEIFESAELWWAAADYRDMHLDRVEPLDLSNSTWLINEYEYRIDAVAVFRDSSIFANFVLLYTKGSDPFTKIDTSYSRDLAGFWRGKYISAAECANGYAEVDGKVIELVNPVAEYRSRYIEPKVLLIAPQWSSARHTGNDKTISTFLESIEKNWPSDPTPHLADLSRKIKKHVDVEVSMWL
jgi:eukaryotic-like serine/threonine-protein kinase